jgi:hypothetical protein
MSKIAHSLAAQSPEFARTGGPHFDIRSSYSGSIGSAEIKHAAEVLRRHGGRDVTLLHTVSAYPTPPDEANLAALKTISDATRDRRAHT